MTNVVTSELYKILKSKIFYGVSIILILMNISVFAASVFAGPSGDDSILSGFYMYQDSYRQDLIFYIILTFICCLVTSEYSNGSIKQISSHGIKRWKIVLGRFISMDLVISFLWILFGVVNLCVFTIGYGLGSTDLVSFLVMNIGLLCMILGMSGIGTFISYLFRNPAISLGVSFIFIMGKDFISSILAYITKSDIFISYSISNMRNIIMDLSSNYSDTIKYSAVFLLFGIISIALSSLLFSVRDIN